MTETMSAKKLAEADFFTKELTVVNKLGIHARPAALFVKTANRFACDIFVEKDGEKISIGLHEEFGELFLTFSFDKESDKIPFDLIEQY